MTGDSPVRIFRDPKTGQLAEEYILTTPGSAAEATIEQIKGVVRIEGYKAAVKEFGKLAVKKVYPDLAERLKFETKLKKVTQPVLEASVLRSRETALKFARKLQMTAEEVVEAEKSGTQLGYGNEQDWLRLANRGVIEAPVVEKLTAMPSEVAFQKAIMELRGPTRAQLVTELAKTPFKANYTNGIWEITSTTKSGLKFPLYITDSVYNFPSYGYS